MPNQTDHSINHQDSRPDNIRDPNSGIDGRTNTKKCYNKYSGVNTDKNSNTDNRTDIALNSNIDNQNGVKEEGNKYNKVNIGNNANINSGEDINKVLGIILCAII